MMNATRQSRRAMWAIILLAVATTKLSWAAPTKADRETARTLMDQADTQFEAKSYAEALKLYQAAHDLMGVPTTGLEVAKAQTALGQLVEARDTALSVTRIAAQPDESKVFGEARREAQALADTLEARIPAILVKVQGVAENVLVSVQVDGVVIPASAAQLARKVNPGKHQIMVSAAGYRSATRDADVPEGKLTEVSVELVREVSAVATVGPTPITGGTNGPRAPMGSATATPIPEKHRGFPTLAYVGFSVGTAGVVVGSVAGLLTLSTKSSIQTKYCSGDAGCTPEAKGDIDKARTFATISNVAFGVGLLGIGVGVVALLASPGEQASRPSSPAAVVTRPSRNTAVHVEPVIALSTLGIEGNF